MTSIAFLLGACLLVAMSPAPTGALAQSASDTPVTSAHALATFDQVWTLVRDKFYDSHLKGVDWNAVGAKYRTEAGATHSQEELAALINRMLHELPASHLGYYTPADTAYYDLITILSSHPRALEGSLPAGVISYPGIGIFTRSIEGKTFITGVLDGFAASRAGLLVGDEIIDVDGGPFAPVESFRGKIGKETSIGIRRTRDGPIQHVAVMVQKIVPRSAYLQAMATSARVIASDGSSIGYVRVWTLYEKEYEAALRVIFFRGVLSKADALVVDIRDGWGGGTPDVLQYFGHDMPLVRSMSRSLVRQVANPRWRSPVALLVNQGTRSMKEIIAYGFQKYGYGDLIGTRTAGAVLGAHGFLLDDGLLLLPAFDIETDGQTLEGRGVTPTIEVPFDIRYADGHDPQLDRAVADLVEKLRQ